MILKQENKSWNGNVVVGFFNSIESPEECQELCQVTLLNYVKLLKDMFIVSHKDETECEAFTWTSMTNSEYQVLMHIYLSPVNTHQKFPCIF